MRLSWFSRRPPRRCSVARRPASAIPLVVRRLERRRVLDASITSIVAPMVVGEGETANFSATGTGTGTLSFEWTVKQGMDTIAAGSGPAFEFAPPDNGSYDIRVQLFDSAQTSDVEMRTLTVTNVEPTIETLSVLTPIHEGQSTTLSGTYDDPGLLDTHELDIDWNGDGVFDETVDVSGGTFQVDHPYPDDEPTSTSVDNYNIFVRLRDNDGGVGSAGVLVTVENVAPQIKKLGATNVSENGVSTLTGEIVDPGTDTFTLEVDWGDGTVETFSYVSGTTSFSETHQYLDDDPSGTANDTYSIKVTLDDDDGASYADETKIVVSNSSASLGQALMASDISENGTTTLSGSIVDPGSLDTFTLEVDWGDGTIETFAYGAGTTSFSETHQYLDDNPSGTASDPFVIRLRLRDDDSGEDAGKVTINVANVAPKIEGLAATDVNEHGTTSLSGNIADPGTQDTFTLEVDWGDGVVEQFAYGAGTTGFHESHQYLDDDPTGTSSDPRTISVKLVDDDTGMASDDVTITISNVAPKIENLTATNVFENGASFLTGNINDPGTLDTFTLEVNWGDGTIETFAYDAGTTNFSESHHYLDDNPTGTASDLYSVSVRLVDDDGGEDTESVDVRVTNIAPNFGQSLFATSINEHGISTLMGSIVDPGSLDTFTLQVDWGDGTVETFTYGAGTTSFSETHQYLDDDPTGTASDVYTISMTLTDDDTGVATDDVSITVANVAPVLTVTDNKVTSEGAVVDLTGTAGAPLLATFTDIGTLDTHAATIDWGDGTALEVGAVNQGNGSGSVGGAHTYADDGTYTVTVTITDDDGASHVRTFMVKVNNVTPTLDVVSTQAIDEGAQLAISNLGIITDPGFDNAANPSGATAETFTYFIDWGDGSAADTGSATIDDVGAVMDPTNASFDGSHIFADNGAYTVTVRVADDDMSGNFASGMIGIDFVEQTFTVVVSNVDPFLTGIDSLQVNEGQSFVLSGDADAGTLDLGVGLGDPGFANPANPLSPPGGSVETFSSYTINWGDGTAPTDVAIVNFIDGGPLSPTTAEFSHLAHTYADNGTYTLTITVQDDDGPVVARELTISVNNVIPTLTVSADHTINESDTLSLPGLGTFTDPGFNNPLNAGNPGNGGQTVETFTYAIDWGDGTSIDAGDATIDTLGSAGVATAGSFGGTHTYADNGVYTVSVTVTDDDFGSNTQTFVVTVNNLAPQFEPLDGIPFEPGDDLFFGSDVTAEGFTLIGVSFSDFGYDNPLNAGNVANGGETAETFTYVVDWGDGTVDTIEVVFAAPDMPIIVNGQTSVLLSDRFPGNASTVTTGRFFVTHRYLGPPDPLNPTKPIPISLTLMDDDFGEASAQIEVQNPGIETINVAIDTTPDVPRLEATPPPAAGVFIVRQNSTIDGQQTLDVTVASSELVAAAEQYLELRLVHPDGAESEGYRLNDDVLLDLPKLFASLPDGRYKIYLVRTENNSRRLVMEVDVRNGRAIDTSDDSEGTRDRPPTGETLRDDSAPPLEANPSVDGTPAVEQAPLGEPQKPSEAQGAEAGAESVAPPSEAFTPPVGDLPTRQSARATILAGITLAAGTGWSARINQAFAQADEDDWKRLRRAGRLGRVFRTPPQQSCPLERVKSQVQ